MTTRKWKDLFQVNTSTNSLQSQSNVTALSDGGFLVIWRDGGPSPDAIRWQRYDAAGVKVGGEVTIPATGTGFDQSEPQVVQLGDGNIWIVRHDIYEPGIEDIAGQVYTLGGTPVISQNPSPPTNISSVYQDPAIAALGPYEAAVGVYFNASANGGDIHMTVFDEGNGIYADNVRVNDTPGSVFALQNAPDVAASPDGLKFVVTWADPTLFSGSYRARVFNEVGGGLTAEFSLNTLATFTGGNSTVTWLDNNRFVAAWSSFSADASSTGIKYAIYNANGSLFQDEQLANSTTFDAQSNPVITRLNDGGFAIAWVDESQYEALGNATLIRLQVFNGTGQKVGSEFQINTDTLVQNEVSLATLADGRIIVTWTGEGDGSNWGVNAQIIDPRDGVINGTFGADKLYGNDATADVISASGGADIVYGLAGADVIYGGAGIDQLYGGRGDDTVRGGADTDYLYGDLGDDEQYGELGNDLMYSGRGADLLDGGVGSDTAYYTSEKTGAVINLLNQLLNAGSADGDSFVAVERFFGSEAAADNITGDNVSNTILGNGGADIINGAGGADVLRGGVGADTINGGTESDLFQYTAVNEVGDSIVNFETIDNFQFTRAAFGNLAGANVAAINFLSVASGHAATTAAHRFIFDQAVDQLWYDADGNAGGAAVMVADLTNNINITNLDLLLM